MKMSTQEIRTARRIWSVLLCLVMALGILPASAMAAEDGPPTVNVQFALVQKVEQGGLNTPPAETFTYVLTDTNTDNPQPPSYYGITLLNELNVSTNGAGKFSNIITAQIDQVTACDIRFWKRVGDTDTYVKAFYLTQQNDGKPDWEYSAKRWALTFSYNTESGYAEVYCHTPGNDDYQEATFQSTYTNDNIPIPLSLPILKTVEQAGNTAPGRASFTFELLLGGLEDSYGNHIYQVIDTAEIVTNGAGTTEHVLPFVVPSDDDEMGGWYDVYLRERPGSDANWKYSGALYQVIRSVDNYGNYRYSFLPRHDPGAAEHALMEAPFTNTYLANTGSAIAVKKVDALGAPLAGAVFALKDDRGYDAYTAISDSRGDAWFTDVAPGQYTLLEISAPDGYVMSSQSYKLSVSGGRVTMDGKDYSPVTFVNPRKAELNRKDHYTFLVGYPDGTFGPSRNMTRAEVTTMFARLITEKIEADKTYSNTFSDVPKSHWATNYIGYMQQFGIINGYPDGTFRPNASVTRAEFAAIASRFEKLTEGTKSFSDVPSTHWAAKYINFAATRGWVTGYPDGTFKPGNPITRAEVAAVTCRLLERTADQDYIRNHPHELRTFHDMTENHWAYWYAMEAANGHDYTKIAGGEQWSAIHP